MLARFAAAARSSVGARCNAVTVGDRAGQSQFGFALRSDNKDRSPFAAAIRLLGRCSSRCITTHEASAAPSARQQNYISFLDHEVEQQSSPSSKMSPRPTTSSSLFLRTRKLDAALLADQAGQQQEETKAYVWSDMARDSVQGACVRMNGVMLILFLMLSELLLLFFFFNCWWWQMSSNGWLRGGII